MKLILFTTGEVTSPNYPNNYPNYLQKTQTIRVKEGLVLSLQFTAFYIESHSSGYCYDHLTITDGDGTTLMEKSCGTTIPADIRSTSNIVKLVFITNFRGTRTGWSVSWSAVTPGECQQHLWMFLVNFSIIDDALKNTRCFQPKQTRLCFSFLFWIFSLYCKEHLDPSFN